MDIFEILASRHKSDTLKKRLYARLANKTDGKVTLAQDPSVARNLQKVISLDLPSPAFWSVDPVGCTGMLLSPAVTPAVRW